MIECTSQGTDRIHSWHALVALDFFVDLMFKSKKKTLLFSIECDLKTQEMASWRHIS